MASASRIASRLRHPTLLDEFKRVLAGMGDNVMQAPRPRVRRSPLTAPRGLFITDGGVPGLRFLDPVLQPTLLVTDEMIRYVIGSGAVVDRLPGWETYCPIRFDRKAAGRHGSTTYNLLALLALAGATAFAFYALKRLLGARQRRLRREDDRGPGGPGPDGPGPSSGWRFAPRRGMIDLVDASASPGSRRFARPRGLLDLVVSGQSGAVTICKEQGIVTHGAIEFTACEELSNAMIFAKTKLTREEQRGSDNPLLSYYSQLDMELSKSSPSNKICVAWLSLGLDTLEAIVTLLEELEKRYKQDVRQLKVISACSQVKIACNSNVSLLISRSDHSRFKIQSSANEDLLHENDNGNLANLSCKIFVCETSPEVLPEVASDRLLGVSYSYQMKWSFQAFVSDSEECRG